MVSIVGTLVFFVMLFNAFWYKRTVYLIKTHDTLVERGLLKVVKAEPAKTALSALLETCEINHFGGKGVAISRGKLNFS